MVLNVSGSEEQTDTTEESGVLFGPAENVYDDDKADRDMTQGAALANPRITSLFTTQRGWRVLRLPGGRAGDEGPGGFRGLSNFMLQFVPGWSGQTIRDSPFRHMVTAVCGSNTSITWNQSTMLLRFKHLTVPKNYYPFACSVKNGTQTQGM